jgi:hypothetical protein
MLCISSSDYRGLKKQIKAIARARQPSSTFLPIHSDSDDDIPDDSSDNQQPPHREPIASGSRDYEQRRIQKQINDSPTSVNGSGFGHARSESKYGSTGLTPPLLGSGRNRYSKPGPSPSSDGHGALGGKRSESPPPVELPQPALPPPPEATSTGAKVEGEQRSDGKGKGARFTGVEASPRSILTVSNNSSDPHSHNMRSRLSLSRAKSEEVVCCANS